MPKPEHNAPTVLVVLGATGDLMSRKIVPALCRLFEVDELPEQFAVIGFSRQEMDDAKFRKHIHSLLEANPKVNVARRLIKPFLETFSYVAGDLTDAKAYQRLQKKLSARDAEWGVCTNKLFYLAVPPTLYEGIFKNLSASGLTEPCGGDEGWTRVVVEKPFGKDLKTAERLDVLLGKLFQEEQIYRIDHYLGKEMLRNILAFRFANRLLEPAWTSEHIARIDVKFLETIDASTRGAFYDGVGALRDVGQNHMLQMLAVLTMDHPGTLTDTAVREKRFEILTALTLGQGGASAHTFRAQYEGFRETDGVADDSNTETYFTIKAELNSERWRGVPIIFEGGKAMDKVSKELRVTFRHPSPCLCRGDDHVENQVVFSLEPEEVIRIYFVAKQPGLTMELEQQTFDFYSRDAAGGTRSAEAYETLLLDCIRGDQLLFVSTGEVEAMWKFIDPILKAWRDQDVGLKVYKKGTSDIRDVAGEARES